MIRLQPLKIQNLWDFAKRRPVAVVLLLLLRLPSSAMNLNDLFPKGINKHLLLSYLQPGAPWRKQSDFSCSCCLDFNRAFSRDDIAPTSIIYQPTDTSKDFQTRKFNSPVIRYGAVQKITSRLQYGCTGQVFLIFSLDYCCPQK